MQILWEKTCTILKEMTVTASNAAAAPSVHTSCDLMSSFTISALSSFPLRLLVLGLILWRTFLFSLLTGSQYYIIQFSVIPLIRWDIFEQIPLGIVFQLPDAWQSETMRMPCKILKFDWTAAQTAWLQQHSYPPLRELVAVRHPYAVTSASAQDESRMKEGEKDNELIRIVH